MSTELDKEYNIELLDGYIKINGIRFYDGMKVKLKTYKVIDRSQYPFDKKVTVVDATVKFMIYEDSEYYGDYHHLGWVVVWRKDGYLNRRTLMDVLEDIIL